MSKNTKKLEGIYSGGLDWGRTFQEMTAPDYNWKQWSTLELIALLRSQGPRTIPMMQDLIRTELNKRPNIPTKAQAKAKRQEKAKEQRNR